jgi:hypothetical protein
MKQVGLLALLAGILNVSACRDGGDGTKTNPGVTGALWNSTSGTGSGGSGGALLWNDPNSGPISGSGGSGDLTYGTAWPTLYPTPPNSLRAVFLTGPLSQSEEYNIEGQVQAYRQVWLQQHNAGAGIGGFGGGAGVATLPPLYISTNLRGIARARCKDLSMGYGTALQSLAARMTAAKLIFATGSQTEYYAKGADAGAAFTAMGTAVQDRSIQGGWFGGGYWTAPSTWGLVFCLSGSITGP